MELSRVFRSLRRACFEANSYQFASLVDVATDKAYKMLANARSEVAHRRHGFTRDAGVVFGSFGSRNFSGTVVFGFSNPRLVHLGDQLFHEPLMRALSGRYDLRINGPTELAPYFRALGYQVDDGVHIPEGSLVVSKHDMAADISRRARQGAHFLGLNYSSLAGEEPVAVALARIALQSLECLSSEVNAADLLARLSFVPEVPAIDVESERWLAALSPSERYYVYNNYVASEWLDAVDNENVLEQIARRRRQEGFRIVHTGTARDRARDRESHDFVDVDIRGETPPSSLFYLFSLPNVEGVISYDTFVMHAAAACRKKLNVVIKQGQYKALYRKRFVPMFPEIPGLIEFWCCPLISHSGGSDCVMLWSPGVRTT